MTCTPAGDGPAVAVPGPGTLPAAPAEDFTALPQRRPGEIAVEAPKPRRRRSAAVDPQRI
jgi:hypothetical protein